MNPTLRDRFFAKIQQPANGAACWIWKASRNAHGYGWFFVDGSRQRAHRAAWELLRGPIPRGDGPHGTCVLHRCDNPSCVNPEHLFLGTQQDNVQDMIDKGRRVGWQDSVTHCPAGHRYDEANTRIYRGGRTCRACQRAYQSQWKKAHRAEINAHRRALTAQQRKAA